MTKYAYDIDVLMRKKMELAMTDADLIQKSGLTYPTLAAIWRGHNVRNSSIKKICEALEVRPADIVVAIDERNGGKR